MIIPGFIFSPQQLFNFSPENQTSVNRTRKKANNGTLPQSSQEVCKNGHGQVANRLPVVSEVPSRPRCMVIRFVLGKTPAIEGFLL